MFDFIQIRKYLSQDEKPFFVHCKLNWEAHSSGWRRYILTGSRDIELYWNPNRRCLLLKGSIMYYWQGHNFSFDPQGFVEAINHIGRLIHLSLWDGIVEQLEFGVVFRVETSPKNYIMKHFAAPKEKLNPVDNPKDRGKFRRWEGKDVTLKMYDEGANIRLKQNIWEREFVVESGWRPECDYLKWECRYNKLSALNGGQDLSLSDLLCEQWHGFFKKDLMHQYGRLHPLRSVVIPAEKSVLKTSDILLLEEVQYMINRGESIESVRKRKYEFVNSLPLTKPDKDARKREIKKLFDRIQEVVECPWNLTSKIEAALAEEKYPIEGASFVKKMRVIIGEK